MANIFSLQIPFCTLSEKQIIQGTVVGNVLRPYEVYEVRCASGEIFNIEAIPCKHGFNWASLHDMNLAKLIGKQIEKHFKVLRGKNAHNTKMAKTALV